MLIIIDYGMGNPRSVWMKFERLKVEAKISSDSLEIKSASHLILPGVGHFAEGIKNLKELNLISVLNETVINKQTPILGICLGMQLLTQYSEEGNIEGLGWINGKTKRFNFQNILNSNQLRIPHVGWNNVKWKKDSILTNDLHLEDRFYFTHSYSVECDKDSESIGETEYGYNFSSVVCKGNIYGTQFHPEKSHLNGLKILENFCKL
jgi:glutamine amidotransferase